MDVAQGEEGASFCIQCEVSTVIHTYVCLIFQESNLFSSHVHCTHMHVTCIQKGSTEKTKIQFRKKIVLN